MIVQTGKMVSKTSASDILEVVLEHLAPEEESDETPVMEIELRKQGRRPLLIQTFTELFDHE